MQLSYEHGEEKSMSSPLVEIKDLNRSFRRGSIDVKALVNINLQINSGEFLALMGPSGSGKTTLLNTIAGIEKPTSGSLWVDGAEIQRMTENQLAEWRNHYVGFVFQTFNLIPVLTASENVELPLLLTGLPRKKRREHVLTALDLVGLSDRASHYPKQLSGGQEQRVAIARAIITDPVIILADEPTGNLDADSAEEILTLLGRLNTELNKTIVMVTHDEMAAEHAQSIRYLNKGIFVQPELKRERVRV
jgi:putative ABC transport system ATP-binding protein